VLLRFDEECKDKSRSTALAIDRLNQNSSAVIDCTSDKTVSDAEVLADVLSRSVLDRQVEVLEELFTGGVRLAGDIEDVGDAHVNQILRLEPRLERPHKNAIVDFNQLNISKSLLGGDFTVAFVEVGEPSADELSLLVLVLHPV